MSDPVRDVLFRADDPDPEFGVAELAGWPVGAMDRLTAAGLIAETGPATSAVCDSCGRDHVEPVVWSDGPGGRRRAFVPCPVAGRSRVDPESLRRWAVRVPGLARAVAAAAGAAGTVSEVTTGRVWKLGTVRAGGRTWVGFLAVGLARPDAAVVVAGVGGLTAPNTLVFVPNVAPPPMVWNGRPPVVVPLTDIAVLHRETLTLDPVALAGAVGPADGSLAAVPPAKLPVGTEWENVTVVVEDRHVRIESGSVRHRLGSEAAGFADHRRTGGRGQLWALLGRLARRGELTPDGPIATKADALKKAVTRLRATLGTLTGLPGDPFRPVRRGGAYRPRFAIRAAVGPAILVPTGATWEAITLAETAAGRFRITGDTATVGVGFDPDPDGGRWEPVVAAGERSSEVTAADLGLDDRAAAALTAVLRAGGTVRRPVNDPGLRAVARALAALTGLLGEPPFEIGGGLWRARFGAESFARS